MRAISQSSNGADASVLSNQSATRRVLDHLEGLLGSSNAYGDSFVFGVCGINLGKACKGRPFIHVVDLTVDAALEFLFYAAKQWICGGASHSISVAPTVRRLIFRMHIPV